MNHLIDAVTALYPNLAGLKEYAIHDSLGISGYNAIFYLKDGVAIGGGTSHDQNLARRIAIAETLERGLYLRMREDISERSKFKLDSIDSTLGFACGFEQAATACRSYFEALEKWALSKVIDDGLEISRVIPNNLSRLSRQLMSGFNEHYFFHKNLLLITPFSSKPIDLVFTIFVGCTEDGAFPGSRVTFACSDQFTHSIIEASRNFNNFKLDSANGGILSERLKYFGTHKTEALGQIKLGPDVPWPPVKIKIHREYETKIDGVYLFRTLIEDFIPVSHGDARRFII